MNNQHILDQLELTAKLMEVHAQNEFKVRAFSVAAFNLDKNPIDLYSLSIDEIAAQPGVGKSMASKIDEIIKTGSHAELNQLLNDTPEGVVKMLDIKGIGPKKVRLLWQELGLTDVHELLLACENGEVSKLKGFGDKIQQTIKESILFAQSKASKLRMDKAEQLANEIAVLLQANFSNIKIVGDVLRKNEEANLIQIIVETSNLIEATSLINTTHHFVQNISTSSPFIWRGQYTDYLIPIEIQFCKKPEFHAKCFELSASESHLTIKSAGKSLLSWSKSAQYTTEQELYTTANLPYIVPEMREGYHEWDWVEKYKNDDLVQWADLKGIIHNHSTYSDGTHTLAQMAGRCKEMGFEYFGIADHSKTATYAQGLPEEKVYEQWKEIDELNKQWSDFKILKGIESDILGDGSLDYAEDILKGFDYVVASIHSNLKMTEEKAMSRLIPAIENQYTTVLGHPTGRLLLERNGYPVNHKKMIDACAANGVVIEINASPYRLDMDWRWIYYAMEKGVMLSLNPDAHKMDGLLDMRYGLENARKGGLVKSMTFNALSLNAMLDYLQKKKK